MRRLVIPGLLLASLAVPLLVIFRGVLFEDEQFAFRDASHYYYPLVLRVQQEWDAGRWPLWAPEAGAGMPLLGHPTAAVLHPPGGPDNVLSGRRSRKWLTSRGLRPARLRRLSCRCATRTGDCPGHPRIRPALPTA